MTMEIQDYSIFNGIFYYFTI